MIYTRCSKVTKKPSLNVPLDLSHSTLPPKAIRQKEKKPLPLAYDISHIRHEGPSSLLPTQRALPPSTSRARIYYRCSTSIE